jgi:hypothetical protein
VNDGVVSLLAHSRSIGFLAESGGNFADSSPAVIVTPAPLSESASGAPESEEPMSPSRPGAVRDDGLLESLTKTRPRSAGRRPPQRRSGGQLLKESSSSAFGDE